MAIKLITDTASDISPELAKQLGIELLPMTVTIDSQEYLSGVELSPNDFYNKLSETKSFPKTSQISYYDFEKIFQKILQNGDTPLVITISSKLSGTYQNAALAAADTNGKAFAVDSMNVCLGQALLVQYARTLIQQDLTAPQIVEKLNDSKERIRVFCMLDTLEYLKRGGRVSPAVAMIGGVLSIKPVISVTDGEIKIAGKARGVKNGYELLNELTEHTSGIDSLVPPVFAYSGTDEKALLNYIDTCSDIVKNTFSTPQILQVGPTIGTHTGPGAVAVSFFEKN